MTSIVIPRGDLGSAELQSNQTTTSTTAVDVPGTSVTIEAGTRPLLIIANLMVSHSVAAGQLQANLIEDGVAQIAQMNYYSVASGSFGPLTLFARRNPTAGSHTYKLQWFAVTPGTITIAGGATYPGLIQVIET